MRQFKKAKYNHADIKNKRYYFYKITWDDITGDAGHATKEEFDKFKPSVMVTHAYIYKKDKKYVWTFSSYEEGDELFSDRNIIPLGCIKSTQKIPL